MSILTKETDLLQFINQKKQDHIDVSEKKIITNYCKVITNAVVKCYEKLSIGKFCLICLDTINNLFWILFLYSKNLKLTMFLCDRAILLFNEYIIMTKSNFQGPNEKEQIHLTDVKSFVYKKTIGPLTLSCLKFNKDISRLQSICEIFRNLYTHFTIYFMKKNIDTGELPISSLNQILEEIHDTYHEVFLKLLIHDKTPDNHYLGDLLNDILEQDEFFLVSIPEKHNVLLLLIKFYQLKFKSGLDHQIFWYRKYYPKFFKISEKKYGKVFKKDILNIETDEFTQLFSLDTEVNN